MSEKILDIKEERLSFFTPAGEVKALNGVSFAMNQGDVLGIVGESGSGKSVTAYSVMGLKMCIRDRGAMGCVAFLFSQKGVIDISLEDKDADEAMMDALDAGAEDFDASEDAAEITTDPENYSAVVKALEEKGYEILSDDLAMVPMTTTRLTDPDQLKAMGKLLDALEENDDVQNVWHSLENEEDLPE